MLIDRLERMGLHPAEAKVYLALLELGESLAGKLSRHAQVNRTTTYESLERLTNKGLVTHVMQANRKLWKPSTPKTLLEENKEQKELIEETLPELERLYTESSHDEDTTMVRGRKGINAILADVLNHNTFVALGSSGRFLEVMGHDFLRFQQEKRRKRIRSRIVEGESARKGELQKVAYADFRYIPDPFSSPVTTLIYGSKVAIMVWSPIPTATVIQNRGVVDAYRKYFEVIWNQAQP